MITNRRRTGILVGSGVAVAAGVAVALVLSNGATAAAQANNAYGFSATGAQPSGPVPYANGVAKASTVSKASLANGDGSFKASSVAVSAEPGRAMAELFDVNIAFDQVKVHHLTTTCTNAGGSVHLDGGVALGHGIASDPGKGLTVKVGDNGKLTLNVQSKNADGSLQIIGLKYTIAGAGGEALAEYNVGVATCGAAPAGGGGGGGGVPTETPTAPAPEPTSTHVAVTG